MRDRQEEWQLREQARNDRLTCISTLRLLDERGQELAAVRDRLREVEAERDRLASVSVRVMELSRKHARMRAELAAIRAVVWGE